MFLIVLLFLYFIKTVKDTDSVTIEPQTLALSPLAIELREYVPQAINSTTSTRGIYTLANLLSHFVYYFEEIIKYLTNVKHSKFWVYIIDVTMCYGIPNFPNAVMIFVFYSIWYYYCSTVNDI